MATASAVGVVGGVATAATATVLAPLGKEVRNDETKWLVRDFMFMTVYLLLTIGAVVPLVLAFRRSTVYDRRWNIQKIFLSFIGVQTTLRFVYFLLSALRAGGWAEPNPVAVNVMGSLPALLFFSTFTMLTYVWASLSHFAGSSRNYVGLVVVVVNVVYYLTAGVTYTLLYVSGVPNKTLVEDVFAYLVGGYSIALAVAFVIYGYRLHYIFWNMRNLSARSGLRQGSVVTKVGWVTSVCLICFTFRGVCLFIYANDISQYFAVSITYFILSEQIPSVLMLYVYSAYPGTADSSAGNSDSNQGSYRTFSPRPSISYTTPTRTTVVGVYQAVDG